MPREDPRIELTRDWLTKARHDLLLAQRAAAPPPLLEGITFHAQQAAEKALKGYLTWRNEEFKQTHDLPSLIKQCIKLESDFGTLTEAAERLNPYLADGRYPGGREPRPAQARQALQLAEQVVAFVLSRLPPDIQP